MPGNILYMKCDANVEINREDVFLKDVASLQCADEHVLAKCKCIKVWHFSLCGTNANNAGKSSEKNSFMKQEELKTDDGNSAGKNRSGGAENKGAENQGEGNRRIGNQKVGKKQAGTGAGKKQESEGIFGKSNIQKRVVVSVLKLVSMVEQTCPGTQVEIIGETDVVIEYTPQPKQGIGQWLKIALVCLVCFFGTAFTIMAYHNDVGVRDVFSEVYEIITHREPKGINSLEISYSIGLAAGILIFFNHIGNLKLTKDPTPIEVSMKNYEKDVNKTLVEVAERNGEELDV